ncbi:sodium:solute symporter [Enterococcus faecalis]|uniref:sodium:solute symporter n=1 Tax=Enterococcus TaxID=1350 RepID=UPI00094E2D4A|nr:sodium:solute symporter [Enterococcus faecalis]EGO5250671.1 sodium:solute symporter [Enterococcus faecalis]EGO6146401.1 sodium:solute symporter [Enterococcus faecalis]EGO8181683.1 sodium:solute symporter [Enterococcus faecalis]EGO9362200.1 sodium:solute symporter [Enterococcus faecalis]EGO9385391.1 sodium:solute symporter [Enterococcus faecalis]
MNKTGFTSIDLFILIAYLAVVLLAGLYFSKKEMKGKEFFKGDGSVPWYVTSVSLFATMLSPISFLGLSGNSYAGSWILWFAQLGMLLAIPLAIKFVLPIFARMDIDTAYDYLERRFNDKLLRVISALLFIVYQLGRMSIIMYLPSFGLAALTGIDINILIILMGVIAIIYSYTGGIKSVLWTDFIQGVVLIGGVLIALFVLIKDINGGFSAIVHELADGKFIASTEKIFDPNILSGSIFLIVFGSGLTIFSSYASSQDLVQRFTTTQSIKKLNKMMYTNGILSLSIATVFYLIGTGLYVFYKVQYLGGAVTDVAQDQIFMYFIAYQLPVGITGIILAAIYAAAQSTISTGLNSVATSWTLDVQEVLTQNMSDKYRTRIAQLVSLLVGIFSIGVSLIMAHSDIKSAYEWFNGFMGLVLGLLGGIFVLGFVSKKANKYGAYTALIVATIIMVCIKYVLPVTAVNYWAYSLISITVSLVTGYVVSVLTGNKVSAPKYTTIYDIPEILSDSSWEQRH